MDVMLFIFKPLMALNGVINGHRPSPQPTSCRYPLCSLTGTGSNQAYSRFKPTSSEKPGWMAGATYLRQSLHLYVSYALYILIL